MAKNLIYEMKLHDVLHPTISANVEIIRVSGGWIYLTYSDGGSATTSVFVPYSNELEDK